MKSKKFFKYILISTTSFFGGILCISFLIIKLKEMGWNFLVPSKQTTSPLRQLGEEWGIALYLIISGFFLFWNSYTYYKKIKSTYGKHGTSKQETDHDK
jgi:hypothetical protein